MSRATRRRRPNQFLGEVGVVTATATGSKRAIHSATGFVVEVCLGQCNHVRRCVQAEERRVAAAIQARRAAADDVTGVPQA